jgi:hypothetical protein
VNHAERAILVALGSALLTSCGNGGGGGAEAPTLRILQFAPSTAFQGGGNITVTGTLDFTSPNGSLSTLKVVTSAGASQTFPLQGVAGNSPGQFSFSLSLSDATVGDFTIKVWVLDNLGLSSNQLTGTFYVGPDVAAGWTVPTVPVQAELNRVIWTGTQFVVAGNGGTILTSPDGTAWTQQSSGTSADLHGIAWSGARLVAVGYGSSAAVVTSTDGVNWSPVASLPVTATTQLNAVACSGTQFVAVGTDPSRPNTAPILRSSDGVTWTASTIQSLPLLGVIWNGRQFVAVGGSSTAMFSGPVAWRSPDGQTWTADTLPAPLQGLLGDLVSAGTTGRPTMVAVGIAFNGPLSPVQLTSPAGGPWRTVEVLGIPGAQAVGWSGSHFLSCEQLACALSADGLNWTTVSARTPFQAPVSSLAWGGAGNGRWVALSGAIVTSP